MKQLPRLMFALFVVSFAFPVSAGENPFGLTNSSPWKAVTSRDQCKALCVENRNCLAYEAVLDTDTKYQCKFILAGITGSPHMVRIQEGDHTKYCIQGQEVEINGKKTCVNNWDRQSPGDNKRANNNVPRHYDGLGAIHDPAYRGYRVIWNK